MIAKVPCITHERCFLRFSELGLNFFGVLSRHYKKVLTVSNVIRNNLLEQGFRNDVVQNVYDGIDDDAYRRRVKKNREDILSEFNIDEGDHIIGLVGNIREWKGQEFLVESLRILERELSNFVCLFIGDTAKNFSDDNAYQKRLLQKIDDYGLSKKIIFTGFRDDVPDLCNALDIQVNASIRPDPFPHVILEAMALGKAVVATDLGGAKESVDDGKSGFLVSSESERQLAEKIKRLLTDNNLRNNMAACATKRVKLFSMESNIKNTEKIYEKLLLK